MKGIFLQILSQLKFIVAFENWQSFYFDIDWCARARIKHKRKILSDYRMILLKIKIPCDR